MTMSQKEQHDDNIENAESSEIEIQPRICISQQELESCYRRHKFFKLIHEREGIKGSSTDTSPTKETSLKCDKVVRRRSSRKKTPIAEYSINESASGDFTPSTESYEPSSESDTDKENSPRNSEAIKKYKRKDKYTRVRSVNQKLELMKIKDNRQSSENKHRRSLSLDLDRYAIQDIDINKSVFSFDSDYFNNVSFYENNNNISIEIENRTKDIENDNQKNYVPDNAVIVAKSSNDGKLRKWDKKQACLFCSKLVAKLPRHLQAKHSKETEVAKIMSFPKGSEERKTLIDELRKKGNYIHNTLVMKRSSGVIIPQKRSKSATSVDSLLPCPSCFAFYSKAKLSRHYSSCPNRDDLKAKKVQKAGTMLLPISEGASEKLRCKVLSRMNSDEVTLVVRQDDLILKLGSKLCNKHDQDIHLYSYISQKMREMARFLIQLRKIHPAIHSLAECINPKFFPQVIEAVKSVSLYNQTNCKYGTPSLALKIGHSLKKCAQIIITESLIHNLPFKREMAENFIKLCENEWSVNISTGALTTLHRNKWNMPDRLPLVEDVKLLNTYLCQERDKYMGLLKNAEVTIYNWTSLAKIVLAQTLLFNRRRAGEVEKIQIDAYLKKLSPDNMDKTICEALSEFEQAISRTFVRFEVRGKKGRKVPIILYPKLIEAYDMLMLYRYHVGIPKENLFFFALPPLSHFRGSDVMRKFAVESGAKQPQSLTSTKLRKNVATMSQILNLNNNELDQLATFMGHDIRVHREYYRLPESTIQLAKISKILIASEKGKLHQFKGKNLDEIDIDINKISDDEESSESGNEDENYFLQPNTKPNITLVENVHESDVEKINSKGKKAKTSKQDSRKNIWNAEAKNAKINIPREENETNKGENKFKEKNATTIKRNTNKKIWTKEEKMVVEDYFSIAIIREKVPGKDDCEVCLKQYPDVLKDRNWKAVKYYVYNIIQRNKKKIL